MADDEEVERILRPIKVLQAHLPQDLQEHINDKINLALDQFKIEKDIATFMKKQLDDYSKATWHCVVGKCFGCSITHATKYMYFLQIDGHYVLIFASLD